MHYLIQFTAVSFFLALIIRFSLKTTTIDSSSSSALSPREWSPLLSSPEPLPLRSSLQRVDVSTDIQSSPLVNQSIEKRDSKSDKYLACSTIPKNLGNLR